MSTTITALSSVTDILDSDLVMITHSNGESFKIAGSEINKRNQAVIASSTTVTGAPLKTGNIVRVYFTADITGSNTSTGLTLNYNNVNYSVKVPKNGTLANFVASDLGGSPTVYKYLQAHTTLELLYDGTQFIIIGNPVVLSSSDYIIYADGYHTNNSVANGNMKSITSNAVYKQLSGIKIKPFSITIPSVTAGETYFKSYEDFGIANNIAVVAYSVEFIGGNSGFDYSGCLYFRDINKQAMYKCEYTQQNLRIYGVIFYTE